MNKISLEQIGLILKERRGNRGIRAVASEIGISAATLSRVESGRQPDLETFAKICRWLKIDPGDVLGFTKTDIGTTPSNIPSVSAHFRADKTMRQETAQHLGTLILAIQRALIDGE